MITVAIRIAENGLDAWLAGLGTLLTIREVDLSAASAGNRPLLATLERNGLRVAHVGQFLPSGFSTFFAELEPAGREPFLAHVKTAALACLQAAPRRLSLELDFRYAAHSSPAGNDVHAAWAMLLRRLLPLTSDPGVVLCLPVSLPPAVPGSRELAVVGNLLYEIMHPACRLALDVYPGELPPDFDSFRFLRDCLSHLEMVRFHYVLALGETLEERLAANWAETLRRHGFKGVVVFAPQVTGDEGVRAACATADNLARLFLD